MEHYNHEKNCCCCNFNNCVGFIFEETKIKGLKSSADWILDIPPLINELVENHLNLYRH